MKDFLNLSGVFLILFLESWIEREAQITARRDDFLKDSEGEKNRTAELCLVLTVRRKRDGEKRGSDRWRERLRKIGAYSSVVEGLVPMAIASPMMGVCARGCLCVRTRRAMRRRGDEAGQGCLALRRHREPWSRRTLLFVHVPSASLVILHSSLVQTHHCQYVRRPWTLKAKITQWDENPIPLLSPAAILLSYQRPARGDFSNLEAFRAFLKTETLRKQNRNLKID